MYTISTSNEWLHLIGTHSLKHKHIQSTIHYIDNVHPNLDDKEWSLKTKYVLRIYNNSLQSSLKLWIFSV